MTVAMGGLALLGVSTQASAAFVVDHSNVHIYTAQEIGMTFQPLDAPGSVALAGNIVS